MLHDIQRRVERQIIKKTNQEWYSAVLLSYIMALNKVLLTTQKTLF